MPIVSKYWNILRLPVNTNHIRCCCLLYVVIYYAWWIKSRSFSNRTRLEQQLSFETSPKTINNTISDSGANMRLDGPTYTMYKLPHLAHSLHRSKRFHPKNRDRVGSMSNHGSLPLLITQNCTILPFVWKTWD